MTLFAQIQKKVYCLDSIWRQGRPSYCPTEAGLAAVTWMWSQGHMAGISIKEAGGGVPCREENIGALQTFRSYWSLKCIHRVSVSV